MLFSDFPELAHLLSFLVEAEDQKQKLNKISQNCLCKVDVDPSAVKYTSHIHANGGTSKLALPQGFPVCGFQ